MKSFLKRIGSDLKHVAKQYREQNCINLAAALSFYTILSLLPILLVVIALIGHYFGQSEEFLLKVSSLMDSVMPELKETFITNLRNWMSQKSAVGWVGVIFLFGAAHFLFTHLERTINRLMHSQVQRHFLITRLLFVAWLIGMTLLLAVPSMVHFFETLLRNWGLVKNFNFILSGKIWFFVFSCFSFMMIVLIIPRKKTVFKHALLGGLIFAALLEGARHIFHFYIQHTLNRYNIIYGSLNTLILAAIWIFYFSNILLICVLWVGRWKEARLERGR